MPARYLTIRESAAAFRVSERTVRRWITRGVLAARKVGGTVRVAEEVLTQADGPIRRPRRGRPSNRRGRSVSALSDDALARTWDNPEDAAYDRWREIYGLREG